MDEEIGRQFQVREQAMALLKVFMVGLAQMTGLDIKAIAGMAARIAETAEKTGGTSLKAK